MQSRIPGQAESPRNGQRGRRGSVVVGLGLAALATYLGLGLFSLKQSYDREMEFARQTQINIARALEDHARGVIDKIDTVLVASRLRLTQALPGEKAHAVQVNPVLASYLALIGEAQSLRVTDATGRFVYDATGQLPSVVVGDRAYFQRNKNEPAGGLVISEPLFARITNNWVITLSRRLASRDGAFSGLVQAAVRAEYFENFYASLKFGSVRSVTLIDDRLRMVARYPSVAEQLGQAIGSDTLRGIVDRGEREAVYTARSGVDGVERLYVVRRVGDYPLYILTGHATADILTNWRQQVTWSVLSATLLALMLAGWIIVWLRTYAEARRMARGMTEAYQTTVLRTRALLDSLPDPAWLTDREQRLIAVNEAFCRACGSLPEDVLGCGVDSVWPQPMASVLLALDGKALETQKQQRLEGGYPMSGGRVSYYECISTPVLDEHHQLAGVAGVARDITQIREDRQRIRHLAEHDQLTDLPNRLLLSNRMAHALARAVHDRVQIAVLFLDLDHFKDINDTLGHEVGDRLLQQVAQRLRASLDERDTISRQGGDEFAVLLQDFGSVSRVAFIAERLIVALGQPFQIGEHELLVGVSIGVSIYPDDGSDIGSLLKNADTAMYQAKAAGGNTYRFFTAEMNTRVSARVALETALRRAIQQNEFLLHYQPQVDARSGETIGVEALVRWKHPEQGEISPARFIPIAEESNLINPLGEWVLREACRQNAEWIARGFAPVVVAVNLSAVQLRQPSLAPLVAKVLAETGLEARWLELEITESAFIQDNEHIIETLRALKALGVKLSVDDFGTGYSSLGYLKQLPVDRIKIDQSFVRDLPHNEDDIAITRAVIGIATSLRKEVIAEGVEKDEQRQFLLAEGCVLQQGYHFSRPLPAAALEGMFSRV